MRRAFEALMLCCAASLIGALPAAARDYPYCIMGCDFGAGDCSFTSYQQCQATASGREAYCAENPYFSGNAFSANASSAKAELRPDRSRQSKRRF